MEIEKPLSDSAENIKKANTIKILKKNPQNTLLFELRVNHYMKMIHRFSKEGGVQKKSK